MEYFRISLEYCLSQFSQVIVLFHLSRKSQNEIFLEFFQLFAVFIKIEKCRLFSHFLRSAALIDSCQKMAQTQIRIVAALYSVAVKMAKCVKIKNDEA